MITYMELSAGHKPAVDTENASVFEAVIINGHEGTLVVIKFYGYHHLVNA